MAFEADKHRRKPDIGDGLPLRLRMVGKVVAVQCQHRALETAMNQCSALIEASRPSDPYISMSRFCPLSVFSQTPKSYR